MDQDTFGVLKDDDQDQDAYDDDDGLTGDVLGRGRFFFPGNFFVLKEWTYESMRYAAHILRVVFRIHYTYLGYKQR